MLLDILGGWVPAWQAKCTSMVSPVFHLCSMLIWVQAATEKPLSCPPSSHFRAVNSSSLPCNRASTLWSEGLTRSLGFFSLLVFSVRHLLQTPQNFFLIFNLNLPCFSLKWLPAVLSLHSLIKSPFISFLLAPFKYWKISLEPSFHQAEQPQVSQPVSMGEVVDSHDQLSGPPLDFPHLYYAGKLTNGCSTRGGGPTKVQ